MVKLKLRTDQVLQSEFQIRDLNLMVVFQVNCPGCLLYALPLAAKLHQQYSDRLNILGLATAFEDFDLNTVEHTQRLLERGEFVGATKLHFRYLGETSYQVPIEFPIAFDALGQGSELFTDEDIEHVCQLTPTLQQPSSELKEQTRLRIMQFLHGRSLAAYTFTVNQLRGTPSWILFDADFTILAQWFGHKSETEMMSLIGSPC